MTVDIECSRLHETDNAVQICVEDTGEVMWIPLSQVVSMHFDGKGHGKMVMTQWIAEQRGLA